MAKQAEPAASVAEVHTGHRDVTGGWLRPAVFGVMDGLVSNLALIAGMVGGGASPHTIVIGGMAGLVAGACSMSSGEFTSVASQEEMTLAEIETERREILTNPHEEERELAGIFRSRGVSRTLATDVARELSADPDVVWRVHVREELGVDPDDLPSPWVAAGSSFIAFASGAIVPLVPYLFGAKQIVVALILCALGLFTTGALVARITVRTPLYGGVRQLLLGAVSAGVTFGIGSLVGAGLS